MYVVHQKSNRSPRRVSPGTAYVRRFVGWPRQAGVHRPADARRSFLRASRRRRQAACGNFLWPFSADSRVTLRVFMIGIRDATGDPPSADEMLVCVTTRYQGVLCSCRQRIYEGSVIYDYHCNESPWVFAQQIVLSYISVIWMCFLKSKVLPRCYLGISAHNAEYHRGHVSLAHCNKLHPVVLHYDCTGMKIEVTVYLYVSCAEVACRGWTLVLHQFLHFEFRLTISNKFI